MSNQPTLYHYHDTSYWIIKQEEEFSPNYALDQPTTWRPTKTSVPLQLSQQERFNRFKVSSVPPAIIERLQRPHSFREYMEQLDHPSIDLLDGFKLEIPEAQIALLFTDQDDTISFHIATHSKVYKEQMRGGWILSNAKGAHLAHGTITGRGKPSFRRAEIWAQLAAATFLHHLRTFHSNNQSMEVTSFLTQAGLANTLRRKLLQQEPFCNLTLSPDWELIDQGFQRLRSISNKLTYYWAHDQEPCESGTQNIMHESFRPRLQQMMKDMQFEDERSKQSIPFYPATKCQLAVNEYAIEANYLQEIREAASLPQFFGYLRTKHAWSLSTQRDVHWEALQRATRGYHQSSAPTLMKLVHGQLATQYRKHITAGQHWISPKCKFCNQNEDETFDHLIRCQHPIAIEFRKNLIISVQDYLAESKAAQIFQDTFLTAIKQWIQNENPLSTLDTDDPVSIPAKAQKDIGWHLLLRGFVSMQWSTLIEPREEPHHRYKMDHTKFYKGLIHSLWKPQLKFWGSYNTWRHQRSFIEKDPSVTESQALHDLKLKVDYLYSLRSQVEIEKQDIYFPSNLTEYLETQTIVTLTNYVENFEPAIKASIERRKIKDATSSLPLWRFPGFRRITTGLTATSDSNTNQVDTVTQSITENEDSSTSDVDETEPSPSTPPQTLTSRLRQTFFPRRRSSTTQPLTNKRTLQQLQLSVRSITTRQHANTTTTPDTPNDIIQTNRAHFHHKHSRWRTSQATRDRFRQFFQRKQS
ncbi:MAG: hypothetical protein ACKOCL_03650 [Candidatus Nanopelagicaceae bacterium]